MDDFVHLLRQFQRTEIRKVAEKGSDDGGAEGTPKLAGDSPSGKVRKEILVVIGISPNMQNSKLQPDASTETPVFTNTQLNLLLTEANRQRLRST